MIIKARQIREMAGETITLRGMLHSVRDMGGFAFLILRLPDGLIQCVTEKTDRELPRTESALEVVGTVREDKRAVGGAELRLSCFSVISAPSAESPFKLDKKNLNIALENEIGYRPLTLRNEASRQLFRLRAGVLHSFRDYLEKESFTEIISPKIVSAGAEGGANIFKLGYFGRDAYLAQSPQFYKQMLIPVYGRVFEIGPVFRAEKHDTPRHLNEYTSVDLELGFIDSFRDIMQLESGMLSAAFSYLKSDFADAIDYLGLEIPDIGDIPSLRFTEAKERAAEKYKRKIRDPFDLEPEEERLISRYAKEELNSAFVFVTHYPAKKRPFYAMDDPDDPRLTLSLVLLFRGLEITTGGQRIHDYDTQAEKLRAKGLNPEDFESYLMLHKYGCPPHGGLGLGLERLLLQLAGGKNIRETAMFPRDTTRLLP